MSMNRRTLLRTGAAAALFSVARSSHAADQLVPDPVSGAIDSRPTVGPPIVGAIVGPILDTHIHLFDPRRAGGVPWPEPGDPIYRPSLPTGFVEAAAGFDVVGAIAIEASPLAGDNDWVLALVEQNPVMVGMIGDLVPGTPEFRAQLARLQGNPRFLGIRYGNLWKRDLAADWKRPGFLDDLKALAQGGLVFETANPNPALLGAVLAIADRVPELRIVVDHMPNAVIPPQRLARRAFFSQVAEMGRVPTVYVKLSEILTAMQDKGGQDKARQDKASQAQSVPMQDRLNHLWEAFGPDKVLYGSDWPNSEHAGSYAETFSVIRRYMAPKGVSANHRFFFRNSQQVYRWEPRTRAQRAD